MEEIDVAVFTFDEAHRLRLLNRAGERLLAQPGERLLGRTGAELGLEECLERRCDANDRHHVPRRRRTMGAAAHDLSAGRSAAQLLVLSDLSKTLREEERLAWQRIIRVLGHEINNSLAPIKSIAGSLQSARGSAERDAETEDDVRQGLAVISNRAGSLSRFMTSYAVLARLPGPRHATVDVATWVRRTAKLETRIHVVVQEAQDYHASSATVTSSTSCSSTSCATPRTRRSRRAAACPSAGSSAARGCISGCATRDTVLPTARTSSCRSSRRSPRARASGSR